MAGAKSGTQHPVVRLCEFILEVLGCVRCEEVLVLLVWCHRSSPGGLQEPALPLALGLASAQSGTRRSPPPPSMATWILLPSALPGSTVRCIPAPPLGSWRRSLLTHRRAVARPPCRAAMVPQVNLRMGKPGGLPRGSPAPKFGGGVIGGDCVVSAMIEQNLTLFDAKKAHQGAFDHDYDPHLRSGLRKEIRSRDSPLE